LSVRLTTTIDPDFFSFTVTRSPLRETMDPLPVVFSCFFLNG
jgi:hypothetical protein